MKEHPSRSIPRRLLCVLVFAVVSVFALAPPGAGAAVAETPLLERKLPGTAEFLGHPAISGSRVVWYDTRSGEGDIHLYDLTTDTETRITDETAYQRVPAISGMRVVWEDYRNGPYGDVYACDLATGVETRITDEVAPQIGPAISGTRVVWADLRNGDWDIYLCHLASGVETRITDEEADQLYPAISGARVIWQDWRNGDWDIYAYNLATGVEERITDEVADQLTPAISGSRAVWADYRNGNADIYAYDLATGVETRITDEAAAQQEPSISDTRVAWEDYRNGNADIYLYDLASGTETPIATKSTDEAYPAISGTRVVHRNGIWDIYLAELLVPRVQLSAAAVVGFDARVPVHARLTSALGMPLAGRALLLQASPDGEHWGDLGMAPTDALGVVDSLTSPLFAKTFLRAVFAGDEFYPAAEGAAIAVKPRSWLSVPAAPASMARTKTYAVSGYLKPAHFPGDKAVTLRCYRAEGGHWVLRKSVPATVSDYSTYSRYAAGLRLPYAGRWRLCAYHADADHAATRSGWRYVGVR